MQIMLLFFFFPIQDFSNIDEAIDSDSSSDSDQDAEVKEEAEVKSPNKSDDAPKSEAAPPQTEVKTEPTSVPSEVAAKPKAEPVDDSRLMPPPAPAALSPGGVLTLRSPPYLKLDLICTSNYKKGAD